MRVYGKVSISDDAFECNASGKKKWISLLIGGGYRCDWDAEWKEYVKGYPKKKKKK